MTSRMPLLLALALLSAPALADSPQQDNRERSTERRTVRPQRSSERRTAPQQRSMQTQRPRPSSPANVRDTSRFRSDDNRLGTVRNARPRDERPSAPTTRIDPNRLGTIRNNPVTRRFDATQRRNADVSPSARIRDNRGGDWNRRVYNGRWAARPAVHFGPERRWARPFSYHWGDRISRLPAHARLYDLGGTRYWVDRGVVYGYGASGYYVTRPPIGLTLGYLPRGYSVYNFGGVPYYYCDNIWYRPAAGINLSFNFDDGDDYQDSYDDRYDDADDTARFEVVQVPLGGMLEELPSPVETVVIGDQTFYRSGDLYFVQVLEGSRVMYLRVDPYQQ